MSTPDSEVERHLGLVQGVERDMLLGPFSRRLLVQVGVVELLPFRADHLDLGTSAFEILGLQHHRHMVLPEGLQLEPLTEARIRLGRIRSQRA